ncbi:MAG: hypothetical protein CK533_03515 [Acidobacterium sp.]|nr:hypothetical protein [Acidobacteriota bacterium]PHY11637.1 MAG: hypothetical protein CK533_03515 [Acidobacterium sp.]
MAVPAWAQEPGGYTQIFSGPHADRDFPVVTARKGAQWNSVLVKVIAQDISASAQAMSDAIAKSGTSDVYGITFATGQAAITPASGAVLNDVLAV